MKRNNIIIILVAFMLTTCSKRNPDARGLEGTWVMERTSMKVRGAIKDSTGRFKPVGYYCFPMPSDDFNNDRRNIGDLKIVRKNKENYFELNEYPGNEFTNNSFKISVEGDSLILADNAVFSVVEDNGFTKYSRPIVTYDLIKVKRVGMKRMEGRIRLVFESSQCRRARTVYEMLIIDVEMRKK